MILFYPKLVTDKGALRNQYGYVSDILPTTLDILGIKPPSVIKGIKQDTLQGVSLAYSINDAKAAYTEHSNIITYLVQEVCIKMDGKQRVIPMHLTLLVMPILKINFQ